MLYRRFWAFSGVLGLFLSAPVFAQISHTARIEIIRTVLAEQAAARIGLPLGTEGVELSDTGQINQQRLQTELRKNGQSIEPGKVVAITDIDFADNKITVVLDGGG